MHQCPTAVEKHLYLDQGRLSLYSYGLFSTMTLFAGNAIFIYTFPQLFPLAIVLAITVVYLTMSYVVGFMGKDFDYETHRDLVAKWFDKSVSADVDIYLPVCKEPIDVILNTWDHVYKMVANHAYAHVYVLDDGKDDKLKDAAKKYGFNYIRREGSELKKAGNLRNAFVNTHGEFIVIFDADFCPRKDFLLETLPYMFENPNTGVVQTPQFFDCNKNYGWVRNGAGAVQELFYRLIQVNRNTFGGAICVGTNAVYRREHLAPFGGTAPMPYSEDVHTGFQLLTNGRDIRYVPVNLALGACPDTVKQFFTQQYRWALGSISLFFSAKFWDAKLEPMKRICYLTGMFYYISTGLGVVTMAMPSIFILLFYPEKMIWFNLLFSVPSLIFTIGFMPIWMKLPMSVDVLRVRNVSYFAHLYALKDFLFNTLEEWKPTGAKTKSARFDSFAKFYTFMAIAVPIVTAILVIGRVAEGYDIRNFILVTFFTLFNAYIQIPVIDDL